MLRRLSDGGIQPELDVAVSLLKLVLKRLNNDRSPHYDRPTMNISQTNRITSG